MTSPLPLAVTMGEPAGIGGELTLKAWLAKRNGARPFLAVADADHLGTLARLLGLEVPFREVAEVGEARQCFAQCLPVLPVKLATAVRHGHPDPTNARATIESIEWAARLAQSGQVAGIVTNPIQKKTLQDAGFKHPGHTEFLAALAGGADVAMMLACPELRVVPVTIHMSVAQAVDALTPALIERTARVAAKGLRDLFGIDRPRLVVAALNPHAGEQGTMGDEENRIIAPAVSALKAQGLDVRGPLPADTLFHAGARTGYDAALCMYHDQALIPIKTIDFSGGVNVTVGLPFVRTSPDHGTALDIAGRGRADPASLIAAINMADDMARRRGG
jgi:4-hydroxythreonine-4-phosphate dehydrogenase